MLELTLTQILFNEIIFTANSFIKNDTIVWTNEEVQSLFVRTSSICALVHPCGLEEQTGQIIKVLTLLEANNNPRNKAFLCVWCEDNEGNGC